MRNFVFSGAILLAACSGADGDVANSAGASAILSEADVISDAATSPAKEGDILFARAWDYHGVKAADDSPLEFVVFKYSSKNERAPTDPNPELPEELEE